jgi:coenzyme F420 hydrogenase subunit beta
MVDQGGKGEMCCGPLEARSFLDGRYTMGSVSPKGQKSLIEKVLNRGICVKCGACVGICPYFSYWDGQVTALDICHAETWRCLQYCPRADYEATSLEGDTGGNEQTMGEYREIWAARAADRDVYDQGQYGGVVSSLLIFAMERNFIDAAVVTDSGNDGFSPGGRLAKSPAEILECAGSRYSASASLAVLNRAVDRGEDRLGVVGLPCQMQALERMARSNGGPKKTTEQVKLRIGLFCTWALDYRALRAFLEREGIEGRVRKYDIPPPPAETFMLLTDDGWRHIPLEEIRNLVQEGCTLCTDMTAEWADISIGTVEGRTNWNTVIIRTENGAKLFRQAVAEGAIEIENLPGENLDHLKEAALSKRRRAEAILKNEPES